jgi:hypothetical protein
MHLLSSFSRQSLRRLACRACTTSPIDEFYFNLH